MAKKLTPWFNWPTRPVYEGWYDFDGFCFENERLYWNGQEWGYFVGNGFISVQDVVTDKWRGILRSTRSTR